MHAGLSNCIFEWDEEDTKLLITAKLQELASTGVQSPSELAAQKAIGREEMARHCRRKTRGSEKTEELIDSLLQSLSEATDTLGVPLFREEMESVWREQRRHVKCLQDPPGVELYTVTGHLRKGGVTLPILRCARGSTSLESFHLHIARFIPGTSASAVNFQAYLLEGIVRWNQARAEAAINDSSSKLDLRTFDLRLQGKVNHLSRLIHGKELLPLYRQPAVYTGELLGVEYLYHQTGTPLLPKDDEQLVKQIDEGFGDIEDDNDTPTTDALFSEALTTFALPSSSQDSDKGSEVSLLQLQCHMQISEFLLNECRRMRSKW